MVPVAGASWPLERTVAAAEDLDWLPAEIKALRWAVAGVIWGGLASLVALFTLLTQGKFLFFWGKAGLVMGGYYAGDRAAHSLMRSRLARLARGAADLSSFASEADGMLMHVKGRVRARETLPALIGEERAVYRRVSIQLGGLRVIHEAAVDFSLVDEKGEQATVQVAGARLLVSDPERRLFDEEPAELQNLALPADFLRELEVRRQMIERGKQVDAIRISEVLVRDGDPVELVGYKTRTVDINMADRLARDMPLRASLRSGKELPLLISPLKRAND
ncbi:MAG TPA: hypothetical protein VH877_28365 [Polyangia bacterium]|jgi:hypothetical protein|nr:hypothetical protein [Polyangia bacterium]